ncbi:peptide/nickel transport system permease protein [Lachnospiraceae bacterium XBB1006]|nr:peptide/nickel transport system permease protein [Lachnospiraceae bacterium XBB1006]
MNKKVRMYGLTIGVVFVLIWAQFGRIVEPYNPFQTNMMNQSLPPSLRHLCGTDNLGRDVFSRILEGAHISLYTALLIVTISFLLGTCFGILSGFLGGMLDALFVKITLIFQAFPSFILAIAVAGILGPGLVNGVISLCAVYWTTYAKLSRSLVLTLKEEPYIKAARVCGATKFAIAVRYLLPNCISVLVVTAALDVGNVIISMAGLSFLGLGAQRPTSEWGVMMSEAKNYIQMSPWMMITPGIALLCVVLIFNLWADTLRDVVEEHAG